MTSVPSPSTSARLALPAFLTIAFAPRTTMRALLERGGRQPNARLVVAAFMSVAVGRGELETARLLSERFGWPLAIVATLGLLALGSVLVVGLFYGAAWFTTWCGRIVGGNGSLADVRAALAWGLVPVIWGLAYRLPAMMVWPAASAVVFEPSKDASIRIGRGTLQFPGGDGTGAPFWQIAILSFLELAVFVWYVVVASRALAEAQKVTPWKALANLLLALILPCAAILVSVISAAIVMD